MHVTAFVEGNETKETNHISWDRQEKALFFELYWQALFQGHCLPRCDLAVTRWRWAWLSSRASWPHFAACSSIDSSLSIPLYPLQFPFPKMIHFWQL